MLASQFERSCDGMLRKVLLVLPLSFLPDPSHHVHKRQQHRHFDQWPHRRRERLVAIGAKRSDGNGDGQLEVVAGRRETLRGGQLVSEAKPMGDEQGGEEDDGEIDNQRRCDPEHGYDLVHHPVSLGGEEHQDGEEKADQGPGG